MVRGILFSSILLLLFCSFYDEPKLEDKLNGVWIFETKQNGEYTYRKARKFLYDSPGVEFKSDGKIIVRDNSGKSGSEPVGFSKYEGTWKMVDSTIIIMRKYWGGDINEVWKLVSVTPTILKVTEGDSVPQ